MEVITLNPQLPQKAGDAVIDYFDASQNSETTTARRQAHMISLPVVQGATFYPLLDGRQFLYHVPSLARGGYFSERREESFFFGGTDEMPFLVRIQSELFRNLDFRGDFETKFFDALVPRQVKEVAQAFGTKFRRQGDIFAVEIPFNWKTLIGLAALKMSANHDTVKKTSAKRAPVFNTRHLFTGIGLKADPLGFFGTSFVEGLIQAPDHEDMKVEQISILFQTANLFNPQEAD